MDNTLKRKTAALTALSQHSPKIKTLLFLLIALSLFFFTLFRSNARADIASEWFVYAPFPIAEGPPEQTIPAVEGDTVIYKSDSNLFGINISGSYGLQPLDNNLSDRLRNLDIKSKRAVYQKSNKEFCSKDLSVEPWNPNDANCVSPQGIVPGATGYNISATDDGMGVYYDGTYGYADSGGIYRVDFNPPGGVSEIEPNNYSHYPFVGDSGAIWIKWQGWEGRYYEDVVKRGSQDVSGPGCGGNTSRDNPRASGSFVFYDRKQGTDDYDIVTYVGDPESEDFDTRCAELEFIGGAGDQQDSEFVNYQDGNGQNHALIVWEDNRNGNWDIYLLDFTTLQEVAVCRCDGDQTNPDITLDSDGQPLVVWQDNRNGNWDIYGAGAISGEGLARKHRPDLMMHPDELFSPRKVDIMFRGEGTTLKALDPPLTRGQYPNIDAGTLYGFNNPSDGPGTASTKFIDLSGNTGWAWDSNQYMFGENEYFLRTNFRDPYDKLANTGEYPETVYSHIVKDSNTGRTAIQYWLPYYFNYSSNFHEGDWEQVVVMLDDNLQPVAAGYSEHDSGRKRLWQYIEGPDSNPIAYVAKGSHANYFSAGDYDAPIWGKDHARAGYSVSPNVEVLPTVSSSPSELTAALAGSPYKWLAYQGLWGEITDNPGGDGPQGPAAFEHSAQWDNPFAWFDSLCWDGYPGCQTSPSLDLIASVASPVEIHLYDVQGNHVGKNDAGGIDEQIPGAEYLEIPELHRKTITLHGGDGTAGYRFVLKGTDTGTFDFTLGSPDRAGNSSDTIEYTAVPVTASTRVEILLDQNKNYSLQIDSDDDGNVDEQRQPDSVVSNAVDLTAPANIEDLLVSGINSDTATLTFTAPGDDESAGAAYAYDIRYSTSPLSESNWKDWMPAEQNPDPLPAGSQVTAVVPGLNGNATYYFAFKAYDEVGNESQVSNVVSVFVPDAAPPVLTYTAPSGWVTTGVPTLLATYSDAVPSGGVDTASATVSLNGGPPQQCSADAAGISCPLSGLADGHYEAAISIADYAGNTGSVTGSFDVDTTAPSVSGILPAGMTNSSSPTVTAAYTDDGSGINSATAQVTLDGNALAACTATESTISCPTSGLAQGGHSFTVAVSDNAGNSASGAGSFQVDTVAPAISAIQPTGWVNTTSPIISAGYADSVSGINSATAQVTLDGNALAACTATESTISCPTSGLAQGGHSFTVAVSDNAGNTASGAGSFYVARDYYWTIYDQVSAGFQNWVLFANPAWAGTPDLWFGLNIAGSVKSLPSLPGYSSGQVPAGRVLSASYPGTLGGPVEAVSTTGAGAATSQRTLINGNSLEEVLGQDLEQLSDHFYWAWYDNATSGTTDWVVLSNQNLSSVYYEIKITGQPGPVMVNGTIPAGGYAARNFPGVWGGPVEARAWSDSTKQTPAKVIASQRVLRNNATAFNELPGTPAEALSSSYYWTWYDNLSTGMTDWVLVDNPNTSSVYYEIRVAGILRSSGTLQAGGYTAPTFPTVMGGPVQVQAWTSSSKQTPANVISSRRVIYGPSFEEIPGYPQESLAGDYHWTWYDYLSSSTPNWVLVVNQNPSPVYYEIRVAGTLRSSGTIAAGGNAAPTFYGVQGGPVEVQAWSSSSKQTPASIMASQRVLWNGHFNEVLGTVLD